MIKTDRHSDGIPNEYNEKVDFETKSEDDRKKIPIMQCCLLTLLSSSFYSVIVHLLLPITVEIERKVPIKTNIVCFVFCLNVLGICLTNSVDPDQTAPVGAV